jgi:hypothetical protein
MSFIFFGVNGGNDSAVGYLAIFGNLVLFADEKGEKSGASLTHRIHLERGTRVWSVPIKKTAVQAKAKALEL